MTTVYIAIMAILLIAIPATKKIANKRLAHSLSVIGCFGICICGSFYFNAVGNSAKDYRQNAMSFYTSQGNVIGELLKEHEVRRIALLTEENTGNDEQFRLLAATLREASGAEVVIPEIAATGGSSEFSTRLTPRCLEEAVPESCDAAIFTFNCPQETYRRSALARRTGEKTLFTVFLNYFAPETAEKMIANKTLTAATVRKDTPAEIVPSRDPHVTFDLVYRLLN